MNRATRAAGQSETPATLVWINSDEAFIVRWDGAATIERVASEVPAHQRSTGHLRHDPTVRHGGGGPPTDRLERDRQAHLTAFVQAVAEHVPPTDAVRIVGPGVVRQRLERVLRAEDRRLRRSRTIDLRASAPLTEHQLVANVRALAGEPAPRRCTRSTPR